MEFDPLKFVPPAKKDPSVSTVRRQGIMLCYPFEEKRLLKWTPPFLVQPKLDGERCRYAGDLLLLSSEMNPILSVPHIVSALKSLNQRLAEIRRLYVNDFLDGELYVHGWDFEKIHSVVSRTANFHPEAYKVQLHVFDIWNSPAPQYERTRILYRMRKHFPDSIKLVPTKICETLDGVLEAYEKFVDEGYEGIVVRNINNLYVPRRSTHVMKFKPKKSDTYLITGVYEAIGEDGFAKGWIGKFECMDDMGSRFKVSPGIGCTEVRKKFWWQNREKLIGRKILVEYQNLTSLRKVPRFGRFPFDANRHLEVL